jgi:uncharacterized protein (DUF2164 family)
MLMPFRIPKEQKDEMIERLITYFLEERSENIGHLAAGQLLDHLMQEIGPYFYNQAMGDARAVVLRKSSEIEDELYALEKPINNGRR